MDSSVIEFDVRGARLFASRGALTQFGGSGLDAIVRGSRGGPITLDCRPEVASVLLQWLATRRLCQSVAMEMAGEVLPGPQHDSHRQPSDCGSGDTGGLSSLSRSSSSSVTSSPSSSAASLEHPASLKHPAEVTWVSATSAGGGGNGGRPGGCDIPGGGKARDDSSDSDVGGCPGGRQATAVEAAAVVTNTLLLRHTPSPGPYSLLGTAAAARNSSCEVRMASHREQEELPMYNCRNPSYYVPYDPPPPLLPPHLQPELDALLDYLGLTGVVYGNTATHLSYGMPLPFLVDRHDARPHFAYRSRPAALVLDGRSLVMLSRGYAHASAPLTSAPPLLTLSAPMAAAATTSAGSTAVAHKVLWKVRLSYGAGVCAGGSCTGGGGTGSGSGGASGSGGGAVGCRCRPDTSLGVLVVHIEDGGVDVREEGQRGGQQGRQRCTTSTVAGLSSPPVISAAAAAAWAGPLPLLAVAMPVGCAATAVSSATAAAAAVAAAAAAARQQGSGGRSTLHHPGFFGWHIAGLAKGYGAGAGTIRVPFDNPTPFAAVSTTAAAPAASVASAASGITELCCPTCQQPLMEPLQLSQTIAGSSSGSSRSTGRGKISMFFEDGDVLLFGLDTVARRLEMHHARLRQTFSVDLPPTPSTPHPLSTSRASPPPHHPSAAACAGTSGSGSGGSTSAGAQYGGHTLEVREAMYAHVCMYDEGEGLEMLDLCLADLQLMGCI